MKALLAIFSIILSPTLSFGHEVPKPIQPLSDATLSDQDVQKYSQELCGDLPSSQTGPQADAELEKFHAIEMKMPPVKDQGYTNWCGVYSASDLLDYYLHSKINEPYSESNEAARVDLFSAINTLIDQQATHPLGNVAGNLAGHLGGVDFDDAVDQEVVLFAAQTMSDGIRSQAEMHFTADDPQVKSFVDAAFAADKETLAALTKHDGILRNPQETDPDIAGELKGVIAIDGSSDSLFKGPVSDKTTIDHYKDFAEKADKARSIQKIHYPAFTSNFVTTSSKDQYLSTLHQLLDDGTPVSLAICSYAIDPLNVGPSLDDGDTCGYHAITAVGAAWVGGECKVRLRNSWGTTWGTDPTPNGYIDLTMRQFLRTRQTTIAGQDQMDMTWITDGVSPDQSGQPDQPSQMDKNESDLDNRSVMIGKSGFDHDGNFVQLYDGTQTDADGAVEKFQGGQIVQKTDSSGIRYYQDGHQTSFVPAMTGLPSVLQQLFKQ